MPTYFKSDSGDSFALKSVFPTDISGQSFAIKKVYWKDANGNLSEVMGGGEIAYAGGLSLGAGTGHNFGVGLNEHVFFMYGRYWTGSTWLNSTSTGVVDSMLVAHKPTDLTYPNISNGRASAAPAGDKVVCTTGMPVLNSAACHEVYNDTLQKLTTITTYQSLSNSSWTDTHAVFIGGYDGSYRKFVRAISSSLTMSTLTDATTGLSKRQGINFLNRAVFAGGDGDDGASNEVVYYTSALVKQSPTSLKTARGNICLGVNSKCLIAAGGHLTDVEYTVEAYNSAMTKLSNPQALQLPIAGGKSFTTQDDNILLFGTGVSAYTFAMQYDTMLTQTLVPLSYNNNNNTLAQLKEYGFFCSRSENPYVRAYTL